MIALVGPDASGKTTLGRRLVTARSPLGTARAAHLGLPPSTNATKTIRLAARAVRKALRNSPDCFGFPRNDDGFVRVEAILDLMTALERRSLALRCFSEAASGAVVITDRYPGRSPGSLNGPRIPESGPIMVRWLGRLERAVYGSIPPPDGVIRLKVPVEETVLRNEARGAIKPEDTVRRSHLLAETLEDLCGNQLDLDGMRSPDELAVEGSAFVDFVMSQAEDQRP